MTDEPTWRRYLRLLRDDATADLDDELRDHLVSLEREHIDAGMSPAAARAEALRRFGDVDRVRSEVRRLDEEHGHRHRRLARFEVLRQDMRFALRQLARSPAFAITATLSIALGIAANVTIFAVANALLLRPIAGAHAGRWACACGSAAPSWAISAPPPRTAPSSC
jgi:putative ABC transport system permease protein